MQTNNNTFDEQGLEQNQPPWIEFGEPPTPDDPPGNYDPVRSGFSVIELEQLSPPEHFSSCEFLEHIDEELDPTQWCEGCGELVRTCQCQDNINNLEVANGQ